MISKESRCCGLNLRSLCFIIGYMHLVSGIVDLLCHLLTVAIVTNGFQCDVNYDSLQALNMPWLESALTILSLGTHGFYRYPRVFRSQYYVYVEQMSMTAEPRCYPGILHIYVIDLLNFLINLIWLKIIISYIRAVHKRTPEPMRMFFSLSVVKLIMQVMYFVYQPYFYELYVIETVWFLKITDILLAVLCLIIVHKYTKFLRAEKAMGPKIEKPPSYIECLINSPVHPPVYEAKDEVVIVDEEKKRAEGQENDVEKS